MAMPIMPGILHMECHRDGTPKMLPMRNNKMSWIMGQHSMPAREQARIRKRIQGPNTKSSGIPLLSWFTDKLPRQKINEEHLRAIEGGDKYGLEAVDLCLVSDVRLLTNFKTLEFDKYKGSSCPRVHLPIYCRKMATYIYDDKVLIHYFQDSLTTIALSWYVSLEWGRNKTWRDLA
ncbi:hypothetical protein CR513_38548, partial [Mucuna pruriens]